MNASSRHDEKRATSTGRIGPDIAFFEILQLHTLIASRKPTLLLQPFRDRRCQPPETVGRRRDGRLVRLISLAPSTSASVSALVSGLVLRALEGVRCRPEIATPDSLNGASFISRPILEGELHSFWFEEHASTTLSLDLSLTMRDPIDGTAFWATDILQDSACPAWIGIGRTLEQGVDDAFETLVEGFRRIFADREFAGGIANASNWSVRSHAGRS